MSESVLVIAAHPDDEVLGCGATIARHVCNGDSINVLFVADGETSRIGSSPDLRRHEPAQEACKILGARPPTFFDFPDQRLDSMPLLDIVQRIESIITSLRPTVVYTHHGGDLNVDHRIVHQAAVTALRPLPGSTYRAIFAFEVASSTEWATSAVGEPFRPNHFVDISAFLDTKMKALQAYDGEMRAFPHARSYAAVKSLATVRGANSGLEAAEAFVTLRTLER
jgi:LmbE family N-acetylglucosaminyl deacetylase